MRRILYCAINFIALALLQKKEWFVLYLKKTFRFWAALQIPKLVLYITKALFNRFIIQTNLFELDPIHPDLSGLLPGCRGGEFTPSPLSLYYYCDTNL